MKNAAKKFQPPQSEAEEPEESVEEEVEEVEEEVKPRAKKLLGIKKAPANKVPAKIPGKKLKSMDEEDLDEQEDHQEEMDEEFEGKGRKTKLNTGKSTKASIKPTTFKKGKWNPNVNLIETCQQLESQSMVPNFDCSSRNSN